MERGMTSKDEEGCTRGIDFSKEVEFANKFRGTLRVNKKLFMEKKVLKHT